MKKLKNNVFFYLILGILAAICVYKILPCVVDKMDLLCSEEKSTDSMDMQSMEVTGSEMEITQVLPNKLSRLKKIKIKFGTYGQINQGTVKVILRDDTENRELGSVEKDLKYFIDNEYEEFVFPQIINLNNEHEYSFTLDCMLTGERSRIAIYKTPDSNGGWLFINGTLDEEKLCFSQVGFVNDGAAGKSLFLVFILIIAALVSLMFYQCVLQKEYRSIEKLDVLFVVFAIVASWLVFSQYGDMEITIKHSEDLLHLIRSGKPGEFYSYVLNKALDGGYFGKTTIVNGANYNIGLYIVLAICMLPLFLVRSLFGIEISDVFSVLYFDFFVICLVVYSAYLVYKIAGDMGLDRSQAKRTAYLYIASPILLFATVGFVQLDIFYIVIVLWAVRKYLKHEYMWFSVLMSVAIMLKSFPILMFIPMILLVEKRFWHIIKYLVVGIACSGIYGVLFGRDFGYSYTKEQLETFYGFTKRLFYAGVNGGMGMYAFLVLIMVALCVWCFDKKMNEQDIWKYVILIPVICYGSLMLLVGWHPQWLAIMVPFSVLGLGISTKRQSTIYCELGISLLYLGVGFNTFDKNADNYMINYGILPALTGHEYEGVTVKEMIAHVNNLQQVLLSAFGAVIICYLFNMTRDILKMKQADDYKDVYMGRGLVYLRTALTYCITMFFLVLYFYVG
ncbi:glycosyltransferase 87 family protein [Blautia sp. 1033sp1_1033st1_G9_1033SCRN_220408]|uniref:glycosyltransferase 87 family protein n=1 Tax=Blautia sp. 1033sp1_1033st1_G9_1033SCRN_220408 TaxID=3144490 RepID=UPI0034A1F2A8